MLEGGLENLLPFRRREPNARRFREFPLIEGWRWPWREWANAAAAAAAVLAVLVVFDTASFVAGDDVLFICHFGGQDRLKCERRRRRRRRRWPSSFWSWFL